MTCIERDRPLPHDRDPCATRFPDACVYDLVSAMARALLKTASR